MGLACPHREPVQPGDPLDRQLDFWSVNKPVRKYETSPAIPSSSTSFRRAHRVPLAPSGRRLGFKIVPPGWFVRDVVDRKPKGQDSVRLRVRIALDHHQPVPARVFPREHLALLLCC